MNRKLTFQNIKVAWRNLMKYKTQNIIAVLCLAVGLVFSSLTFILTQRMWQYYKHEGGGDPRRVRVQLYSVTEDSLRYFHGDVLRRIYDSNLPSIDFIDVHYPAIGTSTDIIDHEGKKHTVFAHWKWISPEHLNYLGLKSAITGKRIPVLKPGDLIMTKGMLERTFGPKVNPVGFTMGEQYIPVDSSSYKAIIDVVDMGDWMLAKDELLVVTDRMKELERSPGSVLSFLDVILAKGKTAEDVQKELQEVVPEFKVESSSEFMGMDIEDITVLSFVGYSVLLIGLFGFLKTQIQLFRLRQREMGLRQCMGAQRRQLFALMMWEIAIVFFFVTLLTFVFTYLLADYALPIIQNVSEEVCYIDMPRTYATELWICLLTFLLTSVIGALSVRRVITTPLSEVVGKSHRTSTRGHSLLIILQMVICQMLVFWVLCFFIFGDNPLQQIEKPDNVDALKSSIVTEPDEWKFEFLDSLSSLQHMEGTTHVACALFRQDLPKDEEPISAPGYHEEADDTHYLEYGVLLTDEHLFGLLDLEIQPLDTEWVHDVVGVVPVFVPEEHAEVLCHKFELKREGEREHRSIEKDKQAEMIGYVQIKSLNAMTIFHQMPSFVYICDTAFFLDRTSIGLRVWDGFENAYQYFHVYNYLILKAKPGEYKAAVKELTDVYQKRGRYMVQKAPVRNLYEVCFSEQRTLELVLQILVVMAVVALLCIVLTLFSTVSLDTRGRQKEVAIRKAHGADVRQIMWIFGKQYVWQLIVSSILTFIISTEFSVLTVKDGIVDYVLETLPPFLFTILFIALITLLTIGYKIYKVSRLEPAKIIKKE